MSERHKQRRDRDERGWQGTGERRYAHEGREERRDRYPDEAYGGERGHAMANDWQSHRGRGWQPNQRWRGDEAHGAGDRGDFGPEGDRARQSQGWGRGYGYGFSDSGSYRADAGERGEENYSSASFGFGPSTGVERGGGYGYGSPYGQGDLQTDRAGRGDWRDTDWAVNRPARGRGAWAGDWSQTRGATEDFTGRGPKDYRRSDDRIREDICDRFTDDPGLDASDVMVKVESGDVTLMGTVSSRDQKRRAEDVAERISGVRDVSNQLRVNRLDATSGTTATQTAARGARAGSGQQGVAADRGREERS